jgi:hypothetical protein
MQITAQEIAAIEEAGMLDQSPVKMIRTKGGFWIAVGRPKGKMQDEALAAGSHPAIVKYNLQKQYPGFQESLMKSEAFAESDAQVDKHSHFLSEELRKSGHDIYSVQKGPDIQFHITKHNTKVALVEGHVQEDAIVITSMSAPKEFARALAGAGVEKAMQVGAVKLRIEAK